MFTHEYFMKQALIQAKMALDQNEVPVGAIVVYGQRIIAKAYNQVELLHDVTAHAEMLAITSATNNLGAKFLNDCILYATLEPCVMCAGAIAHARLGGLVFGAFDVQKGFTSLKNKVLHPKTLITGGILDVECAGLLQVFFAHQRGK